MSSIDALMWMADSYADSREPTPATFLTGSDLECIKAASERDRAALRAALESALRAEYERGRASNRVTPEALQAQAAENIAKLKALATRYGNARADEAQEDEPAHFSRKRLAVSDSLSALFAALDSLASPPKREPLTTWQSMRTAPKDIAVLVLVEASDIPRAVRWLEADDKRATAGAGWYMTWDDTPIPAYDGPRYWMHCPNDPDDERAQGVGDE